MFQHQDAILKELIKNRGPWSNTYLRCQLPSLSSQKLWVSKC